MRLFNNNFLDKLNEFRINKTKKKSFLIEKLKTLLFQLILISLILFLAGCSSSRFLNGPNPETTDFYKGTVGVKARFDEFPNILYYYNEPGNAYNEFEIGINIENKGASYTRGGIFLSGYDPNLIQFEEVPIGKGISSSCGLSLSSSGLGGIGALFHCDGITVGSESNPGKDNNRIFFDLDYLRSLGKDYLDPNMFNFKVNYDSSTNFFNINLNLPQAYLDYYNNGRLMIAFFSGLSFKNVRGREYVLAGNNYEYPGGESDYFVYHGLLMPGVWPNGGLDRLTQKIVLTNCYLYSTFAAPKVCINPNPYSGRKAHCIPKSQSLSSQGGPVAITSVEEESTPKEAIFRFTIRNVGGGTIFDPGQIEKCSPYNTNRLRKSDLDVVYVGQARIGNTWLNCIPTNHVVRLHNGKGTFTCKYPYEYLETLDGYETPVIIELWYGYSETEERTLTIKRVT